MARVDIGDITFGRLPRPGQPSVRTGDISYGMLPRPGGPSVGIGDVTFGRLPRPGDFNYGAVPPLLDLDQDLARTLAASGNPDNMFPMQPGAPEMQRLAHMQQYPHQYGIDSLGGGPQAAPPPPGGFGGMEVRGFSDPVPGRVDLGQDLEQTLAASGSPDASWPMQYGEGERMRIADMMANPGRYEPEPSVSFGQPVIGGQPPAPGGFEFDWDRPPVPARVDLGQDMEQTLAGRPDDSWPMQADPMAARQIAEMSAQASVPGVQPGAMAGPYIPGARMSDPTASPVPDFDMGSMAESPEYMNFQLQQLDNALANQRDVFPRMGADAGMSKRARPASKVQKQVLSTFGGDMGEYNRWYESLPEADRKKITNWSKAAKYMEQNPSSMMSHEPGFAPSGPMMSVEPEGGPMTSVGPGPNGSYETRGVPDPYGYGAGARAILGRRGY